MPAFQYQALDGDGRSSKGLLEGDSPRQVRQQLRERGLTPLSVQKLDQRRAQPGGRQQRLKAGALPLATRQLATLIGAGLPIEQALGAVARQSSQPRVAGLLLALRARVLEGHSLAAALADYPRAFPDIYRATVAAGEQAGYLPLVLERLADYSETRQQLRQKVLLALFYPLLLTSVAVAIVLGLLTYVVPQVVQVFNSAHETLPWLTRALIALSGFLRARGWLLLILVAAAAVVLIRQLRRPGLRRALQALALRLPVLGRLLSGLEGARFARTMSILLASGVPVLGALRITAPVLGLLPLRAAVEQAALRVREGAGLHAALTGSGLPPLLMELIASGETSGKLEAMLSRAASQQEREAEALIAVLLGLFEPLLILLMGGVVLIIVLAILLPIFDLNQLIH